MKIGVLLSAVLVAACVASGRVEGAVSPAIADNLDDAFLCVEGALIAYGYSLPETRAERTPTRIIADRALSSSRIGYLDFRLYRDPDTGRPAIQGSMVAEELTGVSAVSPETWDELRSDLAKVLAACTVDGEPDRVEADETAGEGSGAA